jgi:NAD(P)-dependent dehydrogenase (short-subunit alcohol dehydrogenase family)
MSGRVVMVTGASRGIGAATARLAAKAGYDVCLNYVRNGEAAEAVAKEARALGVRAVSVQADVGDEGDVMRLFQECDRALGPVTGLVNNAGILEHHMRVADMDAGRLQRVMNTNIVGSFLCAREAVRRMSSKTGGKGGSIVNISSVAARLGAPDEYVDYAASKGAIDTMTVGLAKEVAQEGIRVNAVRPGPSTPTSTRAAASPTASNESRARSR